MFIHFLTRSVRDFVESAAWASRAGRARAAPGEVNLAAAVHWLLRSIDVCDGRASSKGYGIFRGWLPAYPETSGYIIPTLIMLGRELGQPHEYQERALRIGAWLRSIQQPSGGFLAFEVGAGSQEDVFDTGMILLGFNALLHETGDAAVRMAAHRAAEFLVASMGPNGSFVHHISHGILHAYNVRSAWALAGYAALSGERQFLNAALANVRWTCAEQNSAGLYRNNSFRLGRPANTHAIAYVMQGLLQIYDLTGSEECLESVIRAANTICLLRARHGWLAADIGPGGDYVSRHVCLTGCAQLAIVLYRLFQITQNDTYRTTADRLLEDAAVTQDLHNGGKPFYGAIAGSFPIYGRYAPLQYPNWATKFFVDALIAKRQVGRGATDLDPMQLYAG